MEYKKIPIFDVSTSETKLQISDELIENFEGIPIILKNTEEIVGFIDTAYYENGKVLGDIWIRNYLFKNPEEEYEIDEIEFKVEKDNYKPIAVFIDKENNPIQLKLEDYLTFRKF